MADASQFLSGINPTTHPNAWRLIMQSMDDFARLGPEEALRRQKILRARTDMTDYAELVYEISPSEHHKAIIEVCEDQSIERGLIIAPPGSAKS